MTEAQARCLAAIKRLTTPDGVSPTVREIADDMGLGVSNVHRLIVCLERDHKVSRTGGARGIHILAKDRRDPVALADKIVEAILHQQQLFANAQRKFTRYHMRRIIAETLA